MFSRRSTFSEEADYCGDFSCFRKMKELTSNWSRFNRVGQIDGFDDTNCTITSKLSENKKNSWCPLLHILQFFLHFMWPVCGTKRLRSPWSRFKPLQKLYSLAFCSSRYGKILSVKLQNQLRYMSILSHTGDADIGHSWLVYISYIPVGGTKDSGATGCRY